MKNLEQLDIRTRRQWRSWLKKNHQTSPGIWLVRHKVHTGVQSMTYDDLVEEALCFGWIDSLIKRLDSDRFLIKVTPRGARSVWSDINRKRYAQLKAGGRLHEAGLKRAPSDTHERPKPSIPKLPAYFTKALKAEPKAWRFFQTLAPGYRRHFVAWVHTAKRSETRERRLRESIRLLAAGQKLGLK